MKAALYDDKPARSMELTDDELLIVRDLHLLTLKPVLYAANVAEDEIGDVANNAYVQKVREFAAAENAEVVPISAKVEAEISELEGEDKQMFLEELGIEDSGLNLLIKAAYDCSVCTHTSQQVYRKFVRGQSVKVPKRLAQRVSFTPTSNVDSSVQKLFLTTIWLQRVP